MTRKPLALLIPLVLVTPAAAQWPAPRACPWGMPAQMQIQAQWQRQMWTQQALMQRLRLDLMQQQAIQQRILAWQTLGTLIQARQQMRQHPQMMQAIYVQAAAQLARQRAAGGNPLLQQQAAGNQLCRTQYLRQMTQTAGPSALRPVRVPQGLQARWNGVVADEIAMSGGMRTSACAAAGRVAALRVNCFLCHHTRDQDPLAVWMASQPGMPTALILRLPVVSGGPNQMNPMQPHMIANDADKALLLAREAMRPRPNGFRAMPAAPMNIAVQIPLPQVNRGGGAPARPGGGLPQPVPPQLPMPNWQAFAGAGPQLPPWFLTAQAPPMLRPLFLPPPQPVVRLPLPQQMPRPLAPVVRQPRAPQPPAPVAAPPAASAPQPVAQAPSASVLHRVADLSPTAGRPAPPAADAAADTGEPSGTVMELVTRIARGEAKSAARREAGPPVHPDDVRQPPALPALASKYPQPPLPPAELRPPSRRPTAPALVEVVMQPPPLP